MEQIRSFIAIELPEEIKTALARLQDRLKTGGQSGVKWVNPYGIHLTLKFLGNIAASLTDEITGAIETAAHGIPPFHLELKETGGFPNLRRVQVAWVGLGGNIDRLRQLHQGIEAKLVPIGFAAESRPFTPHLTLARLQDRVSPAERQSFGKLITSTGLAAAYGFEINSIKLMKSQLTREGAIYSQISSVRLK